MRGLQAETHVKHGHVSADGENVGLETSGKLTLCVPRGSGSALSQAAATAQDITAERDRHGLFSAYIILY